VGAYKRRIRSGGHSTTRLDNAEDWQGGIGQVRTWDTSGMASSNLDLVRSIHASWERGDFRNSEWADPEIEFVISDGPSPGSWSGLAAMAQAMRDWLSGWEDFRIEAGEFRELDDERVLVVAHYTGHGKTSGLEIARMQTNGAELFRVCDDKVRNLVVYLESDRALADLGLAPEGEP
jgi:hypothetical protein